MQSRFPIHYDFLSILWFLNFIIIIFIVIVIIIIIITFSYRFMKSEPPKMIDIGVRELWVRRGIICLMNDLSWELLSISLIYFARSARSPLSFPTPN